MDRPQAYDVMIEIPRGCAVKYEYMDGRLMVDRVLTQPYPANYGYVENTLAEDGDELDAVVVVDYALQTGCVVRCRPLGVVRMEDEEGVDHKVLMVPEQDPQCNGLQDQADLADYLVDSITQFFRTYKEHDPERWSRVDGVEGREKARAVLQEARLRKEHAQ